MTYNEANHSQWVVCPEFKFGVEHGLELHEELGHIVIERGKFRFDQYQSLDADAAVVRVVKGEAECRYDLTGNFGAHYVLLQEQEEMPTSRYEFNTQTCGQFFFNDTERKVVGFPNFFDGGFRHHETLQETPSTAKGV